MQCRTVLTRIDALRTGELPKPEEKPIHEHLKKCKSCDESVDDLRELADAVKSLAVAPPKSVRANVKSSCVDSFDTLQINGKTVRVAFTDRGVRMIHLSDSDDAFRVIYARRFHRDLQPGTLPDKLRRQVIAALSGEGVAKPAVDLEDVTEFERNVLEILTRIPKGEVRTYAWVARQAGNPKAIRAVGNICARNVVPFVVPCHRVVPTEGGVGAYAFGSPMKRELLEREGVPVEELDALAKKGVRYIGSKTTKIFCFPTCSGAMRIQERNRVDFHDAGEAKKKGFRPCQRCQPIAA